MASRVVTQLISDLSGEEIPEGEGVTVDFAYRGTDYRIDLTSQEAQGFDQAISAYLTQATKRQRTRRVTASAPSGDAKVIREWARDQGLDVPARGRIPQPIREKFEAAQ